MGKRAKVVAGSNVMVCVDGGEFPADNETSLIDPGYNGAGGGGGAVRCLCMRVSCLISGDAHIG